MSSKARTRDSSSPKSSFLPPTQPWTSRPGPATRSPAIRATTTRTSWRDRSPGGASPGRAGGAKSFGGDRRSERGRWNAEVGTIRQDEQWVDPSDLGGRNLHPLDDLRVDRERGRLEGT